MAALLMAGLSLQRPCSGGRQETGRLSLPACYRVLQQALLKLPQTSAKWVSRACDELVQLWPPHVGWRVGYLWMRR